MKTVADVCELIFANLNSENEVLAKHATTLLGPRTHGSTTKRSISYVPKNTPLVELVGDFGTAKCYQFETDKLGAILGAKSLIAIQVLGYTRSIIIRDGIHGRELFLLGDTSNLCSPTTTITLIVGEYDNEPCVWTWHPGNPLKPLPVGFKLVNGQSFEDLDPQTAVKLV